MPDDKLNRLKARVDRLQAHKVSEGVYRVYNIEKKTAYNVLQTSGGSWQCDCPWNTKGSRFRSGNCKHLTIVLDKENGCTSCGRKDEYANLKRESLTSPFLCAACRRGGI